jgi:hypothetical protein
MEHKHRGLAFWGIGILIPLLVQAGGLAEGLLRDLTRLGSWAMFIAGGAYYARGKGYSFLVGGLLGVLHILGAFILILLPRRRPKTP